MSNIFNPAKLEKLNNPARLKSIRPEFIWSLLALKDPKIIVDFGAGTGVFSVDFLKRMNDGEVYACDISPQMVDWMNCHILPENPGIKTFLLEKERLPFRG